MWLLSSRRSDAVAAEEETPPPEEGPPRCRLQPVRRGGPPSPPSSSCSNSSDDGPSLRMLFRIRGSSSRRRLRCARYSSGSSNSGDDDGGPSLRMYQPSLLDGLLDELDLPPSADGVEPDSVDHPDLLPYGEILEALTRTTFLDDDAMLRAAVAEYQVHKYLSEETVLYRDPRDGSFYVVPREFHSANDDLDVYSVDDVIPHEEFVKDSRQLKSRNRTPVDEYDRLEPEEMDELELKYALYRIKALLLLKGKAIGKLDDAALESKYPRELIVKNDLFLQFTDHEALGWCFDSQLLEIASLTDYQRLVIINCWEDQYQDWSGYRSHYSTPETDRDYLLYWKAITEKIKWIEDYMYVPTSSPEWKDARRKAYHQAIRIATGFENIHQDLAVLGIEEFLWSTRVYGSYLKDLDGVFYEIWRRVIKEESVKDFTMALKEVYDSKMFPSRERYMKHEPVEEEFHFCTAGITKEVGDSVARRLIAHQVRRKLARERGYEHYARKKLRVAEYIGLIGKAST